MSNCKKCGLTIKWTKQGSTWSCHNPDGSDHWDLCSKTRFELIKSTGEWFERNAEQGYFTALKKSGIQFTKQSGGIITGSLYKPSGDCAECCEPWEVCDWPCPDAIA